MSMEHEQDAANVADVSGTSRFYTSIQSQYHTSVEEPVPNVSATSRFYTSTESEYYTAIGEPAPNNAADNAPNNARVFPTGLREYQSEDIKEVKREGQILKIVEKGQGTKLGAGGQSIGVFEVIVDTGVEHAGRNPEHLTFAAKLFKGEFSDSRFGQWQENVHGLAEYYGGFICKFYGYCRNYRGSFCLIMRKYDCSLRNLIDEEMKKDNNRGRPFMPGIALILICEIAMGMAILHKENIIHRDLKADNVFVFKTPDNIPFGVFIGDFDTSDTTEGTRYWRAPEILEATEKRRTDIIKRKLPWTPMADVYSFGMTCFEILTGHIPLSHHPQSDYQGVYKGGIRPVLPADLNPMIKDLIVKCWHHDPLQRPTFDTIVSELKEILNVYRGVFERYEKMAKLPPLNARPSSEECISRMEHICQDLRSRYPVELFVEREEVDFVKPSFDFLECLNEFVCKFGYKPYIDHPSPPWSLWFARRVCMYELCWLSVEWDCVLPWIEEKLVINELKMIIFSAIREGEEVGNSWTVEEGIDEIYMEAKWASWIENAKNRPPFVDRHFGCIQKSIRGHHGGNKDYPICEFCKDTKQQVEAAEKLAEKLARFCLYHDNFICE